MYDYGMEGRTRNENKTKHSRHDRFEEGDIMLYGGNRNGKAFLEFETRTIELTPAEHKELNTWINRRIWEHCGKVV
jgi:hypothetical protein